MTSKSDPALCDMQRKELQNLMENATGERKEKIASVLKMLEQICIPHTTKEVKELMAYRSSHTVSGRKNPMDVNGEFMLAATFDYKQCCKQAPTVQTTASGALFKGGNEKVTFCENRYKDISDKDKDLLSAVRYKSDKYTLEKINGKDEWIIVDKTEHNRPSSWSRKYGPLVYDNGYMKFKDFVGVTSCDNMPSLRYNGKHFELKTKNAVQKTKIDKKQKL